MSEDDGRLEPDEFIGKLVKDPGNPGAVRVVGFGLGESDRPSHWRLYIDGDLTEYLEFRKEDCLNGKERRDGYTIVWLKQDARVSHTRTEKAAMRFTGGGPVRRFLSSTGFAAMINNGGGGLGTGTGTLVTSDYCCCWTINRGFQTSNLCGPA